MQVPGITREYSGHPDLGDDEWVLFTQYFTVFPWADLPKDAVGFELGSGSGVSASLLAQRTRKLFCIEADPELRERAEQLLSKFEGCSHHADLDAIDDASMDFGYYLGAPGSQVEKELRRCVRKLKPGAPFLTYFCYAIGERPAWFRALWHGSDLLRRAVSQQPEAARRALSTAIAAGVYWPLARVAGQLDRLGVDTQNLPLSTYRGARFETMRQGAQERFAAPVQIRYTRVQTQDILRDAGLERIKLCASAPFWTAVGYRPA